MIDQRLLRNNPALIEEGLKARGMNIDLGPLQKNCKDLKELEEKRNVLQAQGNSIGKEVGQKIKQGFAQSSKEISSLRIKGNEIKKEVGIIEEKEKFITKELNDQILSLPNIPAKDSLKGKDEKDNKEIRKWGKPSSGESLKEHWEIANQLKLWDSEKSSLIAKSRFVTLFNQAAKLERSLINFMLDLHVKKGYLEVLPPALVNTSSLTGSGQLPKFAEESFRCADDDLWLTPTAEVPLTSLHRAEIIPKHLLPLKYVAYSPCFRREAGSYGRDTRGLIRLHQFNKVELYWFTNPEKSEEALEQITSDAESVLRELELPYRVIELCTGDLGFSAKKTYDLEVWLPGANAYREISSCSNCGDFQARRSSIRTKDINKKNILLHTLNGSGLAIGRTMAAVLENGQQSDGSINLPKALIPYFGSSKLKPE